MPYYLGETFWSLFLQYRMAERIISGIVDKTTQALYEVMKEKYLKLKIFVLKQIEIQ